RANRCGRTILKRLALDLIITQRRRTLARRWESLLIGFVRPRLLIGPAVVTAIDVPVAILAEILIAGVLRIIPVFGEVARLRRDAAKLLHPALASHARRVVILADIDVSARLAD